MTDEEIDIYNICLDKKSLYCIRRMGEETCNKCKTYQMYKLGLTEGRKEGFDAGYKKATERAYERQQDLTDTYIKDGEKIKQLEKELESYKALDSHYDEIEEDAKIIAEENEQLKKENARLSKMLYEAIDFIEQEDMQCKLCSFYLSCRDGDCAYKDETPTSDIIRAELEKRVENKK